MDCFHNFLSLHYDYRILSLKSYKTVSDININLTAACNNISEVSNVAIFVIWATMIILNQQSQH